MSEWLTRAVLLAAGVVHLLPASGLLGVRQLQRLYGTALADPGLVLMLRHRALLFALLGVGLLAATASPPLRPPMLIAGLISTAGFCLLAAQTPELSASLRRVALIDVPVALGLAVVLVHHLRSAI